MPLTHRQRLGLLGAMASHVGRNPSHVKYLPQWVRERRASPLELRVPWWNYAVREWLEPQLRPDMTAFEYGSGGSTLWLNDHRVRVTSIEHDPDWGAIVQRAVDPSLTTLRLIPSAPGGSTLSTVDPAFMFDDYVAAIDEIPDGSLDIVIVDGRMRVDCVKRAWPKTAKNGFLILDDSDRTKYAGAHQHLAESPSKTFSGLKPGGPEIVQTTVWKKLH